MYQETLVSEVDDSRVQRFTDCTTLAQAVYKSDLHALETRGVANGHAVHAMWLVGPNMMHAMYHVISPYRWTLEEVRASSVRRRHIIKSCRDGIPCSTLVAAIDMYTSQQVREIETAVSGRRRRDRCASDRAHTQLRTVM